MNLDEQVEIDGKSYFKIYGEIPGWSGDLTEKEYLEENWH